MISSVNGMIPSRAEDPGLGFCSSEPFPKLRLQPKNDTDSLCAACVRASAGRLWAADICGDLGAASISAEHRAGLLQALRKDTQRRTAEEVICAQVYNIPSTAVAR
jgi:hypothetical protein